jgi:hypothetical protein
MGSVAVALRRPYATALGIASGTTAITAALGVFCVRYACLAHEWPICGFPAGCIYNGGSVSPLPTTPVGLPNRATLGIGLYAGFVIGGGALLALATLAYAERPGHGPRPMIWTVAALLALSLVCFRLPPPTRLVGEMGPCITTNSCPTEVNLYPSGDPLSLVRGPCCGARPSHRSSKPTPAADAISPRGAHML